MSSAEEVLVIFSCWNVWIIFMFRCTIFMLPPNIFFSQCFIIVSIYHRYCNCIYSVIGLYLSAALQRNKCLFFTTVFILLCLLLWQQYSRQWMVIILWNSLQKILSYSGCRYYLSAEGSWLGCLFDRLVLSSLQVLHSTHETYIYILVYMCLNSYLYQTTHILHKVKVFIIPKDFNYSIS